jgi:hypothetical protein
MRPCLDCWSKRTFQSLSGRINEVFFLGKYSNILCGSFLGGSEKKKNYRHDENILQGDSLCNNQVQEISILQQDVIDLDDPGYEYVTGKHF